MRKAIIGLAIALSVTPALGQTDKENLLACEKAVPTSYPSRGVGTATMIESGTVCVLYKPFMGEDGVKAPALMIYSPTRSNYSAALKEIGDLRRGQTKILKHYLKAY